MAGQKFGTSRDLKEWSYLILDEGLPPGASIREIINDIAQEFSDALNKCGAKTPKPVKGGFQTTSNLALGEKYNDGIIRKLIKTITDSSNKMLLVFFPSDDVFIYVRVKFQADCRFGVHTVYPVVSSLKLEDRFKKDGGQEFNTLLTSR